MFRSINGMTYEEKCLEISKLKKLLEISNKVNVNSLLNNTFELDLLKEFNITLTPNGQYFDISKHGFLPEMMEIMFADRSKYKKLMIQAEKDYETETDPNIKKELKNKISKYSNLQLAKKVCL